MSCGWLFHFFSSWHAACSWFRTCQGSRKPQRNKSGACCNQRQLWHLTAFSAQWHHVNKTSSGVSTASLVAVVSAVGSGGSGHGEDSGSGVEVWIEELRVLGKGGKFLGSDWRIWVQMSGGDQLRSLRTLLSRSKLLWWKKDPTTIRAFCGAQRHKKRKTSSIYSTWCL